MRKTVLAPFVLVLSSLPLLGQSPLIIPQVADGGGWQTTLVISNTTTNAANVALTFQAEVGGGATAPTSLPLLESVNTSAITIAGGSSMFLHTPGTAQAVMQGWAQLTAPAGIVAYSVFSLRSGATQQDATAPAVTSAGRILVPFDNTNGLTTAIAVANTDTANPVTIAVSLRTVSGALVQGNLPTMLPGGHQAFQLKDQFAGVAGQSGLAEFYAASGSFAIIALRANPTPAFTSAPVYNESGSPIITGSGGGGGAAKVVFGGFSVGRITASSALGTTTNQTIGGQFGSYTQTAWQLPFSGQTFDRCTVVSSSYALGANPPSSPDRFLDAGATIPVSGPGLPAGAVLSQINTPTGPVYSYSQPSLVSGGTYTLTGNGGSQVGPFNVSATLPTNFSVTNWDSISTINRSQPLTINWTGSGFDTVIIGVTGTSISGSVQIVSVTCVVPGNSGSYSIPAGALALLPQIAAGSPLNIGELTVNATVNTGGQASGSATTSTELTPSLVGGGQVNYGAFVPFLGFSKSVGIQ